MSDAIDVDLAGLIELRRAIHAHPELSGQEFATTQLVSERLDALGVRSQRLDRRNGVMCDVGGRPGPLLMLRADLDALAMDDEKQVSYRSRVAGVAHTCGHDVHTAIVVGVVEHLASLPAADAPRVRAVFQPAEEQLPGGALDVVAAGWLDGVDAAAALHCDPTRPTGRIGLRSGPITSAADVVRVELHGPGGHTARPHETVDLATVLGQLLCELPHAVAERCDGHALLVFGEVAAGGAANVIPSSAVAAGSCRTPDPDVWERLHGVIDEAVRELVEPTGADWSVEVVRGVPPVVNDPRLERLGERAATAALGAGSVDSAPQSWGGDDFAWYSRRVPGLYARLGVRPPGRTGAVGDLHTGCFDVDEDAIEVGVRFLVELARQFSTGW